MQPRTLVCQTCTALKLTDNAREQTHLLLDEIFMPHSKNVLHVLFYGWLTTIVIFLSYTVTLNADLGNLGSNLKQYPVDTADKLGNWYKRVIALQKVVRCSSFLVFLSE